ncbi:hypothetical protein I4U23_014099 [Adineta vaga]|nr:hypothetical protein I4U23_014099 [Adineta vaga]
MPKYQLSAASEYRILVLGDRSVGKTSLIIRYVRNEFPSRRLSSDELTTSYQTIIDGKDYTLIFREISTIYELDKLTFSDTIPTACLILFSITDEQSFSNVHIFYEKLRSKLSTQSIHIPILLIANKIDLEHERAVSEESIDKLKFHGIDVFDISVKGNVGIGDIIYTAIKHLQYDNLDRIKPPNACACIIT